MTAQSVSLDGSVDAAEVAKFSALAAEWWDPKGKFAPLHKFNPVRLDFIRREAAAHFGREGLRPFTGLSLLDIGCGGDLLSEPMARLGFAVTGADASQRNIGTARAHAAQSGLGDVIDYRTSSAETLLSEAESFDVVLNMEVVEHVADVRTYLSACAGLVKPGGMTFVATLNKTLKSLVLAKIGAEYVLNWLPRGTHDWNRFLAPSTLKRTLEESGLSTLKIQGVSFDPLQWDWKLSSDVDVNYMVVATRPKLSLSVSPAQNLWRSRR